MPVPAAPASKPARLYLASTSPARLATLRAAGVEPFLIAPGVDEHAAVVEREARVGPLDAPTMVEFLARAKAEAVVGRSIDPEQGGSSQIDGFILGGDSAFELDGEIYGKPHTPEVARERWLLQRGRTGHLHSGHWLIDHRSGADQRGIGVVVTSAVTFASDISDEEIDAYIATGEPLLVAGAFTIDSLGAPFISSVDGDPHAVVGLSLAALRRMLLDFGVAWPSMWTSVL